MSFDANNKYPAIIGIIIIGSLAIGLSLIKNPEIDSKKIEGESISQVYSTYNSFQEMLDAKDALYFKAIRVSPVGTKED
jgi:hypothetical protein